MCYSSKVQANYREYVRPYGADMDTKPSDGCTLHAQHLGEQDSQKRSTSCPP